MQFRFFEGGKRLEVSCRVSFCAEFWAEFRNMIWIVSVSRHGQLDVQACKSGTETAHRN